MVTVSTGASCDCELWLLWKVAKGEKFMAELGLMGKDCFQSSCKGFKSIYLSLPFKHIRWSLMRPSLCAQQRQHLAVGFAGGYSSCLHLCIVSLTQTADE